MARRPLRRIWFVGLWLLFPWPLFIVADAFVPASRYTLLAAVAALVAITEGASGPVALILGVFAVMALATTLACWGLAWIVDRAVGVLPARVQRGLAWGLLALAVLAALLTTPYQTPFGRALRGGLLQVLS